jgi:hypothetical protein
VSELNLTEPVSSKSKAWCMECDWVAWGIWAHTKGHAHHLAAFHVVQVSTPKQPDLTGIDRE